MNTPLNQVKMSVKTWYKYLLEERATMRYLDDEGRKELIPCRVEDMDPTFPWSETYGLLRLKGLNPTEKSSLFSLVHELLPSKDRVKPTVHKL